MSRKSQIEIYLVMISMLDCETWWSRGILIVSCEELGKVLFGDCDIMR